MASATPTSQQLSCPKEKLCAVCKKHDVDLSTCNQCCSIWYCSKACQTADWKLHKLLCKAFSEAIRPQDTTGKTVYRRVIFFHPDKGVPEIQWRDQRVGICPTWPMQPPGVIYGYDLQIFYRDQADTDGSTPNQSIAATACQLGKTTPRPWKGPVIVSRQCMNKESMAKMGGDVNRFLPGCGNEVEDITMADFRRFVEWVVEYEGNAELRIDTGDFWTLVYLMLSGDIKKIFRPGE